jgi:hypothetical protein
MRSWGCIDRILDAKRQLAIKRCLSDEELDELDRLNAVLDRHTDTCNQLGKCPWAYEAVL